MSLDWSHFAPYSALLGGVLVGVAAIVLVFGAGRILGVSGILGGMLHPATGDATWRVAFLAGLAGAPLLAHQFFYGFVLPTGYPSLGLMAVGGLLVGIGTTLANGCTSGHGVCGLSRLSTRSLVATLCFMSSAVATVYISHHLAWG